MIEVVTRAVGVSSPVRRGRPPCPRALTAGHARRDSRETVAVIRKRAFAAWVCLWGALAACLWIGSSTPVDSFEQLETAAHDGAVVAIDHGHVHDPARAPHGTPVEASESEESCGEDGDVGEDPRHLAFVAAPRRVVVLAGTEDCATTRDPCISQHQGRGPPRA